MTCAHPRLHTNDSELGSTPERGQAELMLDAATHELRCADASVPDR